MPLSQRSAPSQPQLRRLLEANRLAVEHLHLSQALRQIVVAAVELVGATYGAIGVRAPDGGMAEFIHVGMDAATVAGIGHTPVGLGLLGAVVEDPRAVRLGVMSADPRSIGVPHGHPMLSSFLGVPLEVRDEIYGHLYLADPRPDFFTDQDQELVEALASTAGVAIAHARLFEESTRREQWTEATSQITAELLSDDVGVDALHLIAERVLGLTAASVVVVVLTHGAPEPFPDLVVDRAVGLGAGALIGSPAVVDDGLLGRCLRSGRPQLIDRLDAVPVRRDLLPEGPLGPAMAVPLPAEDGVRGSLFVLRAPQAPRFTEFDLDVAASLAGQAALALDRVEARTARARNAVLEERDRIARDLHDHVIQRLFAAGLSIQSVCGTLPAGAAAERLDAQIEEIDATIRQIRTTIFGLHPAGARGAGLRALVLEVLEATAVTMTATPEVSFRGPLDVLVPVSMRADVVAVVREGLTNAGRHARASRVEVVVSADPRHLRIEVLDDGRGVPDQVVLSGLDNLRVRARDLGGTFELARRDDGPGSRMLWVVPLA